MDIKKLALSLLAACALAAVGPVAAASPAATWQAGGGGTSAKKCLDAVEDLAGGTWRAAARIEYTARKSFLAVRSDDAAAVCVITRGRGVSILGGDLGEGEYSALTAARPFDYFSSMNYETESVHFGVATDGVAAVSLIGPDGSVVPAVVADGTFIAVSPFGEDSNASTTNHVRATLRTGQVVYGPFRG